MMAIEIDLEQALTALAWSDPAATSDPAGALSRLGVDVPEGLRFEIKVQQPDVLYLVIPPTSTEGASADEVVNQMDLWRSGDQFVWVMPQDAKLTLLGMRDQFRAGRTGS